MMESLSSSTTEHQAIKMPVSPSHGGNASSEAFAVATSRTYPLHSSHSTAIESSSPNAFVSTENTIKRAKQKLDLSPQLPRQKLCIHSLSTDNAGIAPVPVTPDPNSSSKSRSKHSCSFKATTKAARDPAHVRLNKFVRRLHDMLLMEKDSGIVEWRRGLLVLFSTDAFSKKILPKYFNTRNFKTFRRQLNYYGFVHVRSFSATGNTTTALWINQNLAEDEANNDISAVLKLRRVEPNEDAKTVEGRRLRKELAIHTVEEDIGLNSKTLQLDQIRSMAIRGEEFSRGHAALLSPRRTTDSCTSSKIPREVRYVPTDSENSMTSAAVTHDTNYSSNDDESAGSVPLLPLLTTRDETANTDAAASVLLMLSRS